MENSDQFKLNQAKEHVEKIKKFYEHLASYVIVILGLTALNYYQNQLKDPWVLWVAFGWGIGVAANAIKVFGFGSFFKKDWEQRKIREYMEREENKSQQHWE